MKAVTCASRQSRFLTTLALPLELLICSSDLELLKRYGVRIPVVRDDVGRELGWPFDSFDVERWLGVIVD